MSKLTDEQIEAIYTQETGSLIDDSPWALVDFSRAIEAAATEPLLQRIAELERQLHEQAVSLEEARKEVLEEAAEKLEKQHSWITNVAAANLVRALKGAKK